MARYIAAHRQRSVSHADESKHGDIWKILMTVLSDKDHINAFFDHLAKEFCIECGLAYIEFIQFRELIDKQLFILEDDDNMTDPKQLCILSNKTIPKSFVVHADLQQLVYHARHRSNINHIDVPNLTDGRNSIRLNSAEPVTPTTPTTPTTPRDDEKKADGDGKKKKKKGGWSENLTEYQIRAYLLYKKYVDNSSELQINISYRQREELDELLGKRMNRINLDKLGLLNIWDNALTEIWKLMTHSCYRYIKTDAYLQISAKKDHSHKNNGNHSPFSISTSGTAHF